MHLKPKTVAADFQFASAVSVRMLRSGVSHAVLAMALAVSGGALSAAQAATYTASDEAQLLQAINDANADGDVSSTINLAGNITITNPAAFPAAVKALTINTGGFVLSGAPGVGITGAGTNGLSFLGGPVEIIGSVVGGDAAAASSRGVGGVGISQGGGSIANKGTITGGVGGNTVRTSPAGRIAGTGGAGASLTDTDLVNHSVITGGAGGTYDPQNNNHTGISAAAGAGGAGVAMVGGALDNKGTIMGGSGGNVLNAPGGGDNMYGGPGGTGAILNGGTHSNSGIISGAMGGIGRNQGGSSHGASGSGVSLAGGASILNTGLIVGADGRSGGGTTAGTGSGGGRGIVVSNGTVDNQGGEIRGGKSGTTSGGSGGGAAVAGTGGATIINDGTITGGTNQGGSLGVAVQFTNLNNVLELRSDSVINGVVTAGATDTLALGGATDDSFDVTAIGATAQYRGFGKYEKTGSNTWTLTGATTAVTPWTLSQGTLSVSADTLLGAAAGALTFNGGILQVTGTTFTGTTRTINWGAKGGGFDIAAVANSFTVGQTLIGSGALTKLGAGSLVLTGANTYAGGTTISNGLLQLGNGGTTGNIAGDVTNNGTLVFNRSDSLTFGGAISGTGAVRQAGTGTTTFTGNHSYTGGTTIAAGTLRLGDGGTSGSIVGNVANNANLVFNRSDAWTYASAISGSGSVTQAGAGTTILTGNSSYNRTTVSGGALRIEGGAQVANANALTVDGASANMTISGAGSSFTVAAGSSSVGSAAGAGLTVENGGGYRNNSGALVVAQNAGMVGTLTVTGPGSTFHTQSSVGVRDGSGYFSVTNGGQLTHGGGITMGTNAVLAAGGRATILVSGVGSRWQGGAAYFADASLSVLDGGVMQTGASNIGTFTGKTTDVLISGSGSALDALSLNFGTNASANAAITVANGGKLTLRGATPILNVGGGGTINIGGAAGQAATGAGTLNVQSVTLNGGTLNFNHNESGHVFGLAISGTGSVNQNGPGTTILAGGSSHTGGTTIAAGVLQLGNGGTTGAITGNVVNNGALVFNRSNVMGFAGIISGSGSVTQAGPGTTILTNTNSYAGGTTITAGTLQLGGGGVLGTITGDVANNGTLTFNRMDDFVFDGRISGTGSVRQIGTGRTVLTANHSYAGGTAITGGILQLGDGGTTGSIVGDVGIANNSTLLFNRSDLLTFEAVISGNGTIDQFGAGTTVLTGANSYSGQTLIDHGTLKINGDQSAATGTTFVYAGATLGGSGTIGGDVEVLNNGTIAPGNSPGTLTINGALRLAAGSMLDFEFGVADIVGGPLNDLIDVGGNLVLDGTIDVTLTPGGSFGPGIYRVINYDGALTNNGLNLGTVPAGSTVVVQTSIDNQVNLVNTTGYSFRYWDADPTGKDDGRLDGGTGVWQNLLTGDNWTQNPDALINAPFSNRTFAVFAGMSGTVDVDESLGAVEAAGMQFASDGYLVTGDAITLADARSIIRVGDGTMAGGGITATIETEILGSDGLIKTDRGTLVLSGTNSYTGGTTIEGGTLRISSDRNLGAATGALSLDGGRLHTTANMTSGRTVTLAGAGTLLTNAGTALTLTGSVSGSGSLSKDGTGVLVLAGDATHTGGTTIAAGTLQLGNGGTSGTIAGNVTNNGALAFNRSDSLTFGGVISGSGAVQQVGTGTTLLTQANSYSGGTAILGGALQIAADNNLGAAAGKLTFNGGTLRTTADLTTNRTATLGAGGGMVETAAGTTLTYAGVISGAGTFAKAGAGVTILSGTNHYAGATTIDAGSLFVNGDQSAATGLTTVKAGATLGGVGTIGGDVTVADGASLDPGNVGTAPGILTVKGKLDLAANATLNYNFGQPNVVAGPRNDLIQVGGDLVLDGTLNVATAAGGGFGPGIYRVISYGGKLINNGLALGTMPAGSTVSVQTAIAHQVNLVNTGGLTLNYWDGDAGPKFNNAVDGGNGTWQASIGNDNWTEGTGVVNAAYADGAFAIFAGASGTVTVDNSRGAVSASGMQFASDGYVVDGQAITLVGAPSSTVRVGDGTTSGAAITATIAANLDGSSGLVKADLGTLVLSGSNSYTGGTTIDGGTLRISSDRNLGAMAGGLSFDSGRLHTTANMASGRAVTLAGAGTLLTDTGTALTLTGAVSGAGSLTKAGTGTLVLAGDATHTGGTTIAAGTLQLGNGGTSGSIAGNVTNNGALAFSRSDDLTFGGVISGTGAVRQIATGTTILTADNSYRGTTTITAGTLQLGDGGTSGAIAATDRVLNNGTLAFNRADATAFVAVISGSGGIRQIGSGTTVLSGANRYAGATTIDAGSLFVNGDQSAATGLTTVKAGATLGGVGTIGGDVAVADGASLNPGNVGTAPGILTVKGKLDLAANATLNTSFGQPNVVAGARNDLIQVGGDLVLDGTLNVATAAGGSFEPGIYRVISYGGTLTNNGLALGTMPAGSTVSVQTAIAHQVNLVNTAGLTLNYWDGDAGPKFNNAVDGGNGTWQASTGNDNWTEDTGAINAAYADGAFAIFAGASGTVTVDNSLGGVTASGMQFASDGYVIGGQAITLVGAPSSTIRVGDGTASGAAITATIEANLTGGSSLVKADLGTLVLSGSNSYTGGTTIDGGTLRISSDDNLGAAAGGLSFNRGRLHTTANITSSRTVTLAGAGTLLTDAGTALMLTGAVSGTGSLTKDGTGTLVLAGDATHSGGTTIAAGTLKAAAANVLSAASKHSVSNGATLDLAGHDQTVAALGNAGSVVLNGAPGTTLTIAGDYTGKNGAIHLNATLKGDASKTDRLTVGGNTSGDTTLVVKNIGGGGARTIEGIKVVEVGGTSGGSFKLQGDYVFEGQQAVVAGAFGYRLYKNGISSPTDGDWYLRSSLVDPVDPTDPTTPLYQPGAPIYENYANVLQNFNVPGTLQQRVGNRSWTGTGAEQGAPKDGIVDGNGIWARIEAAHGNFDPKASTTATGYDVDSWKLQAGMDGLFHESAAGQLIGGFFVDYGTVSSRIASPYGIGAVWSTGYGFGGTATWYGTGGLYLDGQAKATWYDSDLTSSTARRGLADGNDAFGYALSLEAGQQLVAGRNWSITPQAQIVYSSIDFGNFTDAFGADVSLDRSNSLRGRLGLSADYRNEWKDGSGLTGRSHLYGIANLHYGFLEGAKTDVAGTTFVSRNDRLWGGVGVGGSYSWADEKYSLYGEASANTGLARFGDSYSLQGTAGFRVKF